MPGKDHDEQGATVRFNVSVPKELLEQARAVSPNLSPSQVLQEALRALGGCKHEHLTCASCRAPIAALDVIEHALNRFYCDVQSLIVEHSRGGGSVQGLAALAQELGRRHQIPAARRLPGRRLTRQEQRAAKIRDFPPAAPAKAAKAKPSQSRLAIVGDDQAAG